MPANSPVLVSRLSDNMIFGRTRLFSIKSAPLNVMWPNPGPVRFPTAWPFSKLKRVTTLSSSLLETASRTLNNEASAETAIEGNIHVNSGAYESMLLPYQLSYVDCAKLECDLQERQLPRPCHLTGRHEQRCHHIEHAHRQRPDGSLFRRPSFGIIGENRELVLADEWSRG